MAEERLANAIWREIQNPRKIYTKSQVHQALYANGIRRSMPTLFGNTAIRRILESKAEKKGLALVIERGCIFVTTEEYEILHKTVRMLRYYATLGESIGHEGRGVNRLLMASDPVSRAMGALALTAGVNGAQIRRDLEAANAALALSFKEGRDAANAAFAKARARTL
jgi:hypothetical protein